jgi:hypothetical protein
MTYANEYQNLNAKAEDAFLERFPGLKSDLEKHANELILVHRQLEDLGPVRHSRRYKAIHDDIYPMSRPPLTLIGIIHEPYFMFDTHCIASESRHHHGMIIALNVKRIIGYDSGIAANRLLESQHDGIDIYGKDVLKKYEIIDKESGKFHLWHDKAFSINIGDDKVREFLDAKNDKKSQEIIDTMKKHRRKTLR